MSKYKVGDKFRVVKGSRFNIGDVVTLSDDDGTDFPGFRRDSDGLRLYAFYSDLKPISAPLFEPGKTYRTRGGGEAKIYATDGAGSYPIHGAIDGKAVTWTCDGEFYIGMIFGDDLMPPRPEPLVRKMWMNLYDSGVMTFYDSKEGAEVVSAAGAHRIAVPVMITEIEEDAQ